MRANLSRRGRKGKIFAKTAMELTMLHLLKSEIVYSKYFMIGIILLPILFAIIAMNDTFLFPGSFFVSKYLWSMIVGVGTYLFVYSIWALRKKEFRERLSIMVPLSVTNISFARWLFGIAPFIIVGLSIELLRNFLPEQQTLFIARINGQLGMLFMFAVVVDLVINAWFALEFQRFDKRIIYSLLLSISLFTLSFGVIYAVSTSLIKPFGFGGEEIYFFIWALIISIIDANIFTKRKSFLG